MPSGYLPLSIFMIFLTLACKQVNQTELITYPKTVKKAHIDRYHNIEVQDPYHWLEDDRSPETAEWVASQNKLTHSFLNKIQFKKDLQSRIEELYNYERISAPFKEGEYEYYYKNTGLQDHTIVYRSKFDAKDETEIFLDPNTFTKDGTTALAGMSFTKDGNLCAYMISEGGADWRKVIVRNTLTNEIIEDTITNVKFSYIAWKGNEGFFYSSYSQPDIGSQLSGKTQYHKLMYHRLGSHQNQDKLIFGGQKQPNRYIQGKVTEDENYLVVETAQNTSGNLLYVKDLRDENSPFIQLQSDYFMTCKVVDNQDELFFLYTNIGAPNYRLVSVQLDRPNQSNWQDVIPESDHVLKVGSGGGKFFANYLIDARSAVRQFDQRGNLEREIELPGIGSVSEVRAKKEDSELYYTYSSFTFPSTIYKYNIESGESSLYRKPSVDFAPENYQVNQVFYQSKDGTMVPMFIVHKKGLEFNGKNPTLLYAYGGFNISLTPSFSPSRLAWLENGGIYAQPNIRGGGEYGEEWHLSGTKMNKQNVFDDFISAAEYLIDKKYTSSDYLAISGGSNGGLLVGATMTQRPDLAKVVLSAVGVLDMLRYQTFTAGAGWAADYGTADESLEMFKYLRNYSPYHALEQDVHYPATFVTTSDHDDRVVPAHSFKFTARLQEAQKGSSPVLIRIETKAGHGSVSTKQLIELATDKFAFVWENMGIQPSFAKKLKD